MQFTTSPLNPIDSANRIVRARNALGVLHTESQFEHKKKHSAKSAFFGGEEEIRLTAIVAKANRVQRRVRARNALVYDYTAQPALGVLHTESQFEHKKKHSVKSAFFGGEEEIRLTAIVAKANRVQRRVRRGTR